MPAHGYNSNNDNNDNSDNNNNNNIVTIITTKPKTVIIPVNKN